MGRPFGQPGPTGFVSAVLVAAALLSPRSLSGSVWARRRRSAWSTAIIAWRLTIRANSPVSQHYDNENLSTDFHHYRTAPQQCAFLRCFNLVPRLLHIPAPGRWKSLGTREKFEIDHYWEEKGQPFQSWNQKVHSPNLLSRKCISEVGRIGSIIIFHLSKLWKAKFFILCDVIFLVRPQGRFEIGHSQEWKG